ncbi:MAG: PKD domain-containing protein [Actinomycetota bacterium]|nr:PKD domain-containing protein [Actinomycetota bacterium]
MSRPGRRAPSSIAIAALFALALPAAAQAATFTVAAGGGSCGGGDLTCETLANAAGAVGNNDTVLVSPGQYAGATFNNSGLEIAGAGPGAIVNGSVNFGAGGGGLLRNVIVTQSATAPAITAAGTTGLEVRDVVAVSGGHAILVTAGTNKIVRSTVITAGGGTSGVQINSADAGTKSVRLESTLASGGAAAVRATATGLLPIGNITIEAHHLTAAGSTNGIRLDALPVGLGGSISATIANSIALNNDLNPGLASTATLTPVPGTTNTTSGSPDALFADPANRNFHLKPGSPAINAGGPLIGVESPTDVDGQSRAGAATDLGGDEYVNTAPKAAIGVVTKLPRSGTPVQFDGGGSTDQPGGSIASYRWEFGDGTTQTTTGPTVSHTYKGEGPVKAKLTVVDGEGASSTPASADLTILDGTVPSVTITKPKNKQKINQFVTKTKTVTKNGKKVKIKVKTKTRTRIKFAGKATDKSGISRVILTVEKTAIAKTTTVATGSQSTSTKKCRWLDPKKGLKRTSCAKPILILVKVKSDGSWAYNVRTSIKLSTGTYRAVVYGLDKTGAFGNSAAKAKRNIKFTIR